MGDLIPILGVLTGMVVPIAVFIWLYHDEKNKRQTVLEIAKNIGDSDKFCLLYTSPSPRDKRQSRMPSSA